MDEIIMHNHRHREQLKGARRSSFLDCFVVTLLAMTIFISSSFAQDNESWIDPLKNLIISPEDKKLEDILAESNPKPEGYYAPEFCDFEITFPEKPQDIRRCPTGAKKCYNLSGYTYVYDMSTTVEITASCAPSSAESYKRYTEGVIEAALKGMVGRANIKNYQISTQEDEGYRQGSLLGTTTTGKQSAIYNAQLWVGENSVLTVESKLVGASHEKADQAFSDILGSIQVKN